MKILMLVPCMILSCSHAPPREASRHLALISAPQKKMMMIFGVSSPLPKKRRTVAREQRVRRDLEVFDTAPPPGLPLRKGEVLRYGCL